MNLNETFNFLSAGVRIVKKADCISCGRKWEATWTSKSTTKNSVSSETEKGQQQTY